MRIGIDIDNTITDTRELMIECVRAYAVAKGLSTHFDLGKYTLEEALLWKAEELQSFRNNLPDIYRQVAPKPHALEVIQALYQEHYIILITSRNQRNLLIKDITLEWLNRNQVAYHELVMNNTENMHHFNKLATCLDHRVELMIEDHDGQTLELSRFFPVILFDYPYNAYLEANNIIRVHNWLEVKPFVNHLTVKAAPKN